MLDDPNWETEEVLTDVCDQATAEELRATRKKIEEVRAKAATLEVEPTGSCLYCNKPLATKKSDPVPRRFCNSDCRDGWQEDQDYRGRVGAK